MKRVLCGMALAATAFVAVPAHAAVPLTVTPVVNDDTIGVSSTYGTQPLVGAYVHPNTGTVCAGLSYEVPFCATAPVHLGP